MNPTCPHCGSENLDAEFVDVGCGVQATPYGCYECNAQEFYNDDAILEASDIEVSVGWHMGPDGITGCPPVSDIEQAHIGSMREALKKAYDAEAAKLAAKKIYLDEALF